MNYLLEAYAKLGDLPVDVSLLLVGDGPDEAAYRAYARDTGLRNVVFAGFQQQEDLPRFYASSDVLVFPTLGDPNGLVVEEAMASQLPVVSSDAAGDIRSRVPDGVAGYVVPAGDSDALAERMRSFALDGSARASMGVQAGKMAAAKGHDRYASDFERFVDAVLTSPRLGG